MADYNVFRDIDKETDIDNPGDFIDQRLKLRWIWYRSFVDIQAVKTVVADESVPRAGFPKGGRPAARFFDQGFGDFPAGYLFPR